MEQQEPLQEVQALLELHHLTSEKAELEVEVALVPQEPLAVMAVEVDGPVVAAEVEVHVHLATTPAQALQVLTVPAGSSRGKGVA